MRKIISVLLVICLAVLPLGVSASASESSSSRKTSLSSSVGIQALRDEFESDTAPKAGNYALDYCYYSPVGENDNTKYPLVIFLHGIGHADYPDAQLDDSDMPYWASSELQSRFTQGGAFVLLPRAPEHELVYWNDMLIEPLRAVIDDMIAKHGDNIDTTKIFIGGSSAGGEMTWNMAVAFPEYFAGIFPIAATGTFSTKQVELCSDIAIWMFASDKDPIINYTLATKPLWNTVCSTNAHPESCRLSTLGDVIEPAGGSASDNHHMAKVVTYDFHMLDGSTYDAHTENGNGETINLESPNGIISWMNTVSSDYDGAPGTESGNITVNFATYIICAYRNIMFKIVNIFQRLLGL